MHIGNHAYDYLYSPNIHYILLLLCMLVEDGDFITEPAREVLRGAELDDLQSLFADEMRVSNSPMGCPT